MGQTVNAAQVQDPNAQVLGTPYDAGEAEAERQRLRKQQAEAQGFQTGTVFNATQAHPGGAGFSRASSRVNGETVGQRYLNMQKNFAYGGNPLAADQAIATERATAKEAATRMGTIGHGAELTAAQLQAAQTPVTNYHVANTARNQQAQAYAAMMAAGQAPEGPSAAGAQLQAGTNQALAADLAAARSGRGAAGAAAGMNHAAAANAGQQQGLAAQAMSTRAAEMQGYLQRQQQAFGGAGQLASQMRGGDIGQSEFLTQSELKNREIADQAGLGFTGLAQQGYQGAAETTLSSEQLANQIQMARMAGTMGYENTLQNYQLHRNPQGPQGPNPYDYTKSAVAIGSAGMDFYNSQKSPEPTGPEHSSGSVTDMGSY